MIQSKPDNATFNFFKAHKLKLNIAFYKKLDILELQKTSVNRKIGKYLAPSVSHKSESERCETAASTLSTSFAAIIVIKPHLDHSFSVSTHMPVHNEPENFKLKDEYREIIIYF